MAQQVGVARACRDRAGRGGAAMKTPRAVDREIARLREIVAETGDALLLADGPVSPDAALLEVCAETLDLLIEAERLGARQHALHDGELWDDRRRAVSEALADQRWGNVTKAGSLL